MPRKPNRRQFLKASTAAGLGYWVAGTQSAWAASKLKNGKINVGSIGAGGMGGSDVHNLSAAGANIVALCDVDWNRAKGSFDNHPDAKKFKDFREMLDKMDKEIDACNISTPDHTHAVATMAAMKAGKHVYTQKPLTHDVYEARVLTEAAKKTGLVTQMGNQGTSEPGLREAVEVVWSGVIGPVKEVHVWTNRPVWPQGAGAILNLPAVKHALMGKGEARPTPPEGFDYDLWLGTAPERPFPGYDTIMPFNWRGWLDFGTGALGDMACHTANMAFMACKLGYPISVESEVSEWNDQTFPMWSVVRYEFPERDGLPPLKWTWYDGGADKPAWVNRRLKQLAHGMEISGSGSLLIGEKMTLYSPNDYGAEYYLLPKDGSPVGPLPDAAKFQPPSRRLPRHPEDWTGPRHWKEFVVACEQNKPDLCMARFDYAGPLTETVVLGCVAMRAGKRIEWDGLNLKITNTGDFKKDPNQYLRREYRNGWTL